MPLTSRPNIQQQKSIIRQEGRKGVQAALKGVQQRHEAIVKPWKKDKDKPDFEIEIERKGRVIIGRVKVVGQEAESAGITVWQLLEHGTKIRFMMLSKDWQSKTAVGRLSSGSGAGRKLDLDFENPEPGITKREWGKGVAKAQETGTETNIEEGWKNGLRKAIGIRGG